MARKVSYRLTGAVCPVTGAPLAEMDVTAGKATYVATKRVFTDAAQCAKLPSDELVKLVNYAEDLFVRAATTRAHTPKGAIELKRTIAAEHWRQYGDQAALLSAMIENRNASLDRYWSQHESELQPLLDERLAQ